MSQPEFDRILQQYLDGNCSPEEEEIILAWYETFINETEIVLSAGEKLAIRQRIWANIRPGIPGIDGRKAIPLFRRAWVRVAAAASLVVAIATGYWLFHSPATPAKKDFSQIQVPAGYTSCTNPGTSMQVVALPDGSRIELQPQSTLYYPAHFTAGTRDVYLSGNAFFRVAHDTARHFIVHTEEGLLAEVLGTSFYVSHDKATNKVEVAVVTGKVSVYEEKGKGATKASPEAGRIILTPNQKVSYKPVNNQFITSLVEEPRPLEQNAAVLPSMSFVFEDAPLSVILKDLQESYGITIETENEQINHCHFTGDISRQGLYDKLDIICKSTQSSYEVRGTVIYIRGKGCN